ncbi:MAG: hypothetical protein M1829_000098 [Trizodia sp. TS-e1964]|nr:MAG: hypothetical protein M1829_000098 [Trizodia sp. TS-e1964]
MASATGIPQQREPNEEEPLLGRPGDAAQVVGKPIQYNLVLGTAIIAQIGIWILTAIIWISLFRQDLTLFSAHPLLNSAGLLLLTQGILILQPTRTVSQKTLGTNVHAVFMGFSLDVMIAGLVIIEVNKFGHNGLHFRSLHAILGLISYILLGIQALVGITQFYFPQIYGSVNNAKALYKFHRIGGYLALLMMLATIAAATQIEYVHNTYGIRLWTVVASGLVILTGVLPRIKFQKLGLRRGTN